MTGHGLTKAQTAVLLTLDEAKDLQFNEDGSYTFPIKQKAPVHHLVNRSLFKMCSVFPNGHCTVRITPHGHALAEAIRSSSKERPV